MKFQGKFYDIIDYNKCPSSKKSAEKFILRKSFFHHSEPKYNALFYLFCEAQASVRQGSAWDGPFCANNDG